MSVATQPSTLLAAGLTAAHVQEGCGPPTLTVPGRPARDRWETCFCTAALLCNDMPPSSFPDLWSPAMRWGQTPTALLCISLTGAELSSKFPTCANSFSVLKHPSLQRSYMLRAACRRKREADAMISRGKALLLGLAIRFSGRSYEFKHDVS